MMALETKKRGVILISSLLLLLIAGCKVEGPIISSFETVTSTPFSASKQITASSLPFVEKWRWSGQIFTGAWYPPVVAISHNRVIVAEQDRGDRKIRVFDTETGETLWESGEIRHLASLATSDQQIFVGSIRFVQSFNLETGEELWRGAEQPLDKKGFLDVYETDKFLQVYDYNQHSVYLLDPKTGRQIGNIQYPSVFFIKDALYFSGCGYGYKTACLRATDQHQKIPLWSRNFDGLIYLWPTFIDDSLMILNAGGQLFAINPKTGDAIWDSGAGRYVTGVSIQNDVAYALKQDATLVALNPHTGEEIGVIKMTPGRTIEDEDGYVTHYAVATSDQYVAVYYGNSQELIVFEKTSNLNSEMK